MAIEPLRWTTTADAGAVLTTVGTALQSLGYTVTPNADGWSGRAEVGSKVGRALAGGFVRRMIVNYQVGQGVQPETSEVQIAPAMSGIGGGALGISKAKKEMASIAQAVHGALAANDQLAQIDSQFLPPAPGAPPQG
ncbi:hypothetical protein [Candidatus Neomicrothrix sp.]|jgi:hypothetical protein|uniref:hypothetical protein n=1 Tax=Candidatus Neomicrothrix sp. TaxID=2719034 RepID=UPI000E8899D0|nr:hypothetical protein [Candidatus Microthrix sp.]HBX10288.1 hypothetical protein [Candidatus Microthrix parvicella]MBK6502229.1 hypothetical protein [Candidatus Microthrix sp.]MBL0203755.1 hypothetical protein [Candidatus Microthrix sp.]MBP7403833.1 hypothetical protein [Candidatus Microthrix sp.]MBP7853127.1 hypothetical protein [Candidatus Microthrix sp.]